MYPTFQQTFVYILYKKFSCHSAFNFVYKMYANVCRNVVYILYTIYMHQLYTSCTIFVYKMYTQFPCGVHSLISLGLLNLKSFGMSHLLLVL